MYSFRAVKLCLQSKGHQHQCSWKGQRKQNWKPPRLHSQFTALLPKSIWDLSKRTGHWHQLDSWTSPPRPHQLGASSAGCQSSHTFVLSPSPQPAKKDASSKPADGRSRRSQGATALCPLFPGDSLRRAGYHHPGCQPGLLNFEVSDRWHSGKGRTAQHLWSFISSLKRLSPFWIPTFSRLWSWAGSLGPPPLHTCSDFQHWEVTYIGLDFMCTDHRTQ